MSRVFILCGLQFSGKSHVSDIVRHACHAEVISFDDIKTELFPLKISPLSAYDWMNVKSCAIKRYTDALIEGKTVVWDSTNPLRQYREELITLAKLYDYDPVIIFLNTTNETIVARRGRNIELPTRHQVDDLDFETTKQIFEAPTEEEGEVVVLSSESEIKSFSHQLQELYSEYR